MKVAIVSSSRGRRVDGVRDHARQLARALESAGHSVVVVDRVRHGFTTEPDRHRWLGSVRVLRQADWIIFEYSPFGLGRWGFAPWALIVVLVASRLAELMVFVHEPFLVARRGRSRVIAAWQRLQLRLVMRRASVAAASIGPWRDLLTDWRPSIPIAHIAVGSNLPDGRAARGPTRESLGVSRDDVVVMTFSTGHDSALTGHIVAAIDALRAALGPCLVLHLGTGPAPAGVGSPVVAPGWLEASTLAGHVAAADMLLAPFVDGVSTRRTTVAAALQHGVPVVTTAGHLTDAELLDDGNGLVVTAVSDIDGFARGAVSLARDPVRRHRLAAEARKAYVRRWDSPVAVAQIEALFTRRAAIQ